MRTILWAAKYLTLRSCYFDVGDEVVTTHSVTDGGMVTVKTGGTGTIVGIQTGTCGHRHDMYMVRWNESTSNTLVNRNQIVRSSVQNRLRLTLCSRDEDSMAESYFQLQARRKSDTRTSIGLGDLYTLHALRNPMLEGMYLLEILRDGIFELRIDKERLLVADDDGNGTLNDLEFKFFVNDLTNFMLERAGFLHIYLHKSLPEKLTALSPEEQLLTVDHVKQLSRYD
eukprot:SAG11_NODE_452_length_9380_cov_10.655533_1_plen_226_part_10